MSGPEFIMVSSIVLAEELNHNLPQNYVARMDSRLYVEQPSHDIIPDIALMRRPRSLSVPSRGGAALLEPEYAPETFTVLPLEISESYIEIRTLTRPRRIITVIEILSPANKSGGAGRNAYLKKQQEILESDANLLEIDLLRRGPHTVAVPREGVAGYGTWDYLACLNRAASRATYEFWRIGLRQRLPRLRIPLSEGEPDASLDLQAAFNRVYDGGRFREETDYNAPPLVALEGDDADWADLLLREKGLRDNASTPDAAQE